MRGDTEYTGFTGIPALLVIGFIHLYPAGEFRIFWKIL